MTSETAAKPRFGLYGLGTMGSALALNIAEKGFPLAVCNRTNAVVHEFYTSAGILQSQITPTETLTEMVAATAAPRNIILMVPAGPVVDETMARLRPLLDEGDLIIDAGNANFEDTNRRASAAHAAGEMFLGIGVSGGEEGARRGPSIMGGGDQRAWARVSDMLQAIAAKYKGIPCATWMGPGGAGHFVKMVHNGIEYADMQMIAEVYGIMRDGFQMDAAAIGDVYSGWNKGRLKSYLIEISAAVSKATDLESNESILDVIKDSAGQKGTGRWTAVEALKLASPVTAIDAAVAARNLSSRVEARIEGEELFGVAPKTIGVENLPTETLEAALLAGKIACYAQGFDMLATASQEYEWNLPLPEIAQIWREGCIIRSAMLNDMADALGDDPQRNLMNAPAFADMLRGSHDGLRQTIAVTAVAGHPVPALSAALSYFDTMRTSRGTTNMIQAQRDFFGAHGFERLDKKGKGFHGPWGSR